MRHRMSRFSLWRFWAGAAALTPPAAHAFSAHVEDAIADVMVWVVIIFVPILLVWLFWKLHILPEVVAEKRHHPQKDAIQALCLTSLLFGGLLWPIAWIWACTKPIGYRLAYGRDKHDDYYAELKAEADEEIIAERAGEHSPDVDAEVLRRRIARLQEHLRNIDAKQAGGSVRR